MLDLIDLDDLLLKAFAALQPLALLGGAGGLLLNAAALRNTNKMAKQQKSYEFMREFTTDKQFIAFRNFVQNEFQKHSVYAEWCQSPSNMRETKITMQIGNQKEEFELGFIVNDISNFYDRVGVLCAANAIDPDLIVAFVGSAIIEAWRVLEPGIINADRERREKRISSEINFAGQYIKYQGGFAYLASVAKCRNPPFGRKLVYGDKHAQVASP
jgi:hypothetical protein